jgi:hypothetical protein
MLHIMINANMLVGSVRIDILWQKRKYKVEDHNNSNRTHKFSLNIGRVAALYMPCGSQVTVPDQPKKLRYKQPDTSDYLLLQREKVQRLAGFVSQLRTGSGYECHDLVSSVENEDLFYPTPGAITHCDKSINYSGVALGVFIQRNLHYNLWQCTHSCYGTSGYNTFGLNFRGGELAVLGYDDTLQLFGYGQNASMARKD